LEDSKQDFPFIEHHQTKFQITIFTFTVQGSVIE